MQDLTAKRTLVKSQPELWEELSEVERLAKHLGAFGEISITKLEPEHKVAWEGEHASGTVSIEPSGWGTKVILTAELTAEPVEADAPEPVVEVEEPVPEAPAIEIEEWEIEPEPATVPVLETEPTPTPVATVAPPAEEPQRRRRRGFWSRLFAGWFVPEERLYGAVVAAPEPPPAATVEEEAPTGPETEDVDSAEESVAETAVAAVVEVEPNTIEEMPPSQDAGLIDHERAQSVLEETLEALGSAHHRPFSRG